MLQIKKEESQTLLPFTTSSLFALALRGVAESHVEQPCHNSDRTDQANNYAPKYPILIHLNLLLVD